MSKTLKCICLIMLVACNGCNKVDSQPSLEDTIAYMRQALTAHNGQRLSAVPADVTLINKLSSQGCKLTYEVSNYQTVHYDLSDIDTKTIKVEPIGDNFWVTFKTRDFHRSVSYESQKEKEGNYTSEAGGFSLDSKDVADSFQKALLRATSLCGGKPSSF